MDTLEEALLAQKRLSMQHQPGPKPVGNQELLDALSMMTGPVPGVGALTGAAADAHRFATESESRTPFNVGLSLASLMPFGKVFQMAKALREKGKTVVFKGMHPDRSEVPTEGIDPMQISFATSSPAKASTYATSWGSHGNGGFNKDSNLLAFEVPKEARVKTISPKRFASEEDEWKAWMDPIHAPNWDALKINPVEARRAGLIPKDFARALRENNMTWNVTTRDVESAFNQQNRWDALRLRDIHDWGSSTKKILHNNSPGHREELGHLPLEVLKGLFKKDPADVYIARRKILKPIGEE